MPAGESTLEQQIEVLYSHHHGWLERWLRKKLGDAFDAADVAQDTFVRVLTAPDGNAGKQREWMLTEPRAYLTVIAKRLAANLYRRRALEHAYLEALAMMPESQAMSPEERRILLDTLQEIDAMLDSLPGKIREAFLLAQIEDLSYAEIAVRLAVSERTIKRYMVQAMARCIVLCG